MSVQDYPQQYVITMRSGAVHLVSVLAPNRDAGQEKAKALSLTCVNGDSVWDCAAYPWNGHRPTFAPGLLIIKGKARKPPRLIVEYMGCTMFRNTSPGYALRWTARCNDQRLAADTQNGLRELIRETLKQGAMK